MAEKFTKIAIVTGSNKGLGFSIVKGLCQKYDGSVYLTARDEQKGLNAVKELEKLGFKPLFYQLDVSDNESVKKFANYIKTKHGGFEVLVNNAAVLVWDEVYPTFDTAKTTININYKSLLLIEKYLFPLLKNSARVVNISSPCGHLSNLKNKTWIEALLNPSLTVEVINKFVDSYLEDVKNGTFKKTDFADDGKHAEYRVSKIAFTALSNILQKKYVDRNISINCLHPGHVKTDMANGGGDMEPDEAAENVLYLILEAPATLKGVFMWFDRQLINWYDADTDLAGRGVW